jgi:endonuclease/exonuclease/phosphatase family metal-dependent hydrolase
MGDFNFDSERHFSELDPSPLEETDSLQALFPDYLDAWRSLKYQSGDLGKTFDTDINEMLKYMRHRHEKMRYDRIMLKSKSHNGTWKLKKVDMLGDKPFVTEKGCPVHISDHFGLCLDITWETPQ